VKVIYSGSTWVIPILIATTFHEAAHAYAAWRLGDDTALRAGRVTFNPLKHVDPFGTILIPALLLVTGFPFLFGGRSRSRSHSTAWQSHAATWRLSQSPAR
jgi:Zn-dependent protease